KAIEPVTIITDNDAAAAAGIRAEFPGTKHFLCVWHFMMNVNEHASAAWGGGGGRKGKKKDDGDGTEESTNKTEFLRLFKKAMYSTSEAAFDSRWATLMGWAPLTSKPKLLAYLKRLHADRHRWAFFPRSRFLTLGMTASQRVESYFNRLKIYLRNSGRKKGLLHIAQHIHDVCIDEQLVAAGEGDTATGIRSRVQLDSLCVDFFDKDVLTPIRKRFPTYLCDKVRLEIVKCGFFAVQLHDARQGGGWLGPGETAGAVAAAAQPVEDDDALAADPDSAELGDDRPRLDPAAMAQAFADKAGYDVVCRVTPHRQAGSSPKSLDIVCCNTRTGTHVCSCTMILRYGYPCRHFWACYLNRQSTGVTFSVDRSILPRWRAVLSEEQHEAAAGGGAASGAEPEDQPTPAAAAAAAAAAPAAAAPHDNGFAAAESDPFDCSFAGPLFDGFAAYDGLTAGAAVVAEPGFDAVGPAAAAAAVEVDAPVGGRGVAAAAIMGVVFAEGGVPPPPAQHRLEPVAMQPVLQSQAAARQAFIRQQDR
ncbi:unnamed protein product, partial [Phaeothamnion confervicola]